VYIIAMLLSKDPFSESWRGFCCPINISMFQAMKDRIKKVISALKPLTDNDGMATGIMRWPRPVAFFLLVILFVVGWFNPTTLLAYASALAAFPQDFWNVVFIILGSIAGSKGMADIGKLIKR
jgi:hypothetical protein